MQRDATIPADCLTAFEDACRTANALLCAEFVWKKFIAHAYRKRWRIDEVGERWLTWVDREIKYTHERVVQQRARDRPGLASTTAPLIAERMQWARDAEAHRAEVLAAAAQAMAVFS